jgi:RNA polymerase sigma-70 factor (ECF subfamily)
MKNASPEQLVDKIRNGERAAEAELYRRYQSGVLYLLKRRCGDVMQAQDLRQETFRVVLERLRNQGLEQPHQLARFIHRVAENLFIGEIRKVQRRQTYADTDSLASVPDGQLHALDLLSREDTAQSTRQLLDELSIDRDRELLRLYYLEEYEKSEICEHLSLSPAHFDRVLYRAKQRFRKLLLQRLKNSTPE